MSNEAPTDALRLPDRFVQLATDAAWARNVDKATAMMVDLDDLYALLLAAKAAPASPLPGGGDWIDGTPEVPVGSPTWCGWASYEIRRLRAALPAAPTGDARNGKGEG